MKDSIETKIAINRVEVISKKGREYINLNCHNVQVATQDDGQTLKIFIDMGFGENTN